MDKCKIIEDIFEEKIFGLNSPLKESYYSKKQKSERRSKTSIT